MLNDLILLPFCDNLFGNCFVNASSLLTSTLNPAADVNKLTSSTPSSRNDLPASSVLTSSLLAVVCVLSLCILRRRLQQQQQCLGETGDCRLPPGSVGWPLIGETVAFVVDGRSYFRSRYAKYGPIFRTHLLGSPTVVVIGAENVRRVLTTDERTLTQAAPGTFPRLFGRALCTMHGSAHRGLQRAVLRAFNHENLSRFAEAVQHVVRSEMATWVHADRSDVVMCVPACHKMSLDVVCDVLLGVELNSTEAATVVKRFSEFSDAAFAVPVDLPGFAFHKGMEARRELLDIISARMNDVDSSRSILSAMWSPSNSLSSSDQPSLVDVTLELMYGSHESTTSVMCTALIQLANNPQVVHTVRQELAAAGISCCTDDDVAAPLDDVSYDVLRTLTYTSDVVTELLRIQPPIAGAFRRTLEPMRIGDFVIPAGWGVLYGITDTHETSPVFDCQLEFDPSRWQRYRDSIATEDQEDHINNNNNNSSSSSSSKARRQSTASERYNYIPFGGGSKRFCVGKQFAKLVLQVFIVELVRSMKSWKLVNGIPKIRTAPIPIPRDDLPVVFNQ